MIAHTAPLSEITTQSVNVATVNTDTKNGQRGKMLSSILPNLLINAGVPFVVNMLAQSHMSTINALLLASSVPALFTLGGIIWKKRIDAVGMMVVVGLLLTAIFALLFKSPQLLLLRGAAVSGLFGIAMLVSLCFPKPILFYVVRSVMTHNDVQRIASFNADWAFPQVRSLYRLLTIVWGCVTLASLLLLAVFVFTLPISLMLVLSPILNIAVTMPAAHWSMYIMHKNKPAIDQLRQQRDTVIA